jgi:hypothetical protein
MAIVVKTKQEWIVNIHKMNIIIIMVIFVASTIYIAVTAAWVAVAQAGNHATEFYSSDS